jgi:hypothetical protein
VENKLTMDGDKPQLPPNAVVAGNPWLSADVRPVLDALVATAAGTLAGILVDSGFGLRMSVINAVYRLLSPLFDALSAFPNGQLVLADFIYRVPVVLIVGMLTGLVLRYFRYSRLVIYSTLVWLVYLVGRKFALAIIPATIGEGDPHPWNFFQILPEVVLLSMQYTLLILVLCMTDRLLARSAVSGPVRRER